MATIADFDSCSLGARQDPDLSVHPLQMVSRTGIRALFVSNTSYSRYSFHPFPFSPHECGRLRRQYDEGSLHGMLTLSPPLCTPCAALSVVADRGDTPKELARAKT